MSKVRIKSQATAETFITIHYLHALWRLLTIAIAVPCLLVFGIMLKPHLPAWMLTADFWAWLPFILIGVALGIPFGLYRANLFFGNLNLFFNTTHRIKLILSAWTGDFALPLGIIGAVLLLYVFVEKSNLFLRVSAAIFILLLLNNITFWISYLARYYHFKGDRRVKRG